MSSASAPHSGGRDDGAPAPNDQRPSGERPSDQRRSDQHRSDQRRSDQHPSDPRPGGPVERRIRGVGAIVFDESGRLLLIQRGHAPAKGQWSVPGGKVERGESDQDAVMREVAEETGLTVTVGDLAGMVERAGRSGVGYEIYDYDAALAGSPAARPGVGADPGAAEALGAGAGPGPSPGNRGGQQNVTPRGASGPGRAASDAADLRWVLPEELGALPLTEGLVEALRRWGRLP